jgi:hypothetical protein
MTVYYLVVGSLLTLGSLAMIAWPRQVWLFTRGWRFANPEEVRLSAAHVAWTRLSGAVGVVLGIVLLVYAFR